MKITALYTYPVKSCRGLHHQTALAEARGFEGDRRWMIVDHENNFLTQRQVPAFATFETRYEGDGLIVKFDGGDLKIPVPAGNERAKVRVWGDEVEAAMADQATNEALTKRIGRDVKLVYMDDLALRTADPDFTSKETEVGFADGFPFLITSEKSLKALNDLILEQGGEAVGMERFRPNIVVDGEEAWQEDGWAALKIGDCVFDLVKPCARCVMTTQDQKTGTRNADNQPIRALTKLRRSGDPRVKGVLFGWNACGPATGMLRVGDGVEVLSTRPAWPVL